MQVTYNGQEIQGVPFSDVLDGVDVPGAGRAAWNISRAVITRFVDISDPEALAAFRAVMFPYAPSWTAAYLESLVLHIRSVQEAGRKLGVDEQQLRFHDQSKFSDAEFPAYAEHFHGGKPNPDRFAAAWLHHIHANPHHWNHWLFADGFSPKGSNVEAGAVEMPRRYALEMVADWMGSSMAYTGSWDMTKWLTENMGRIRLHSRTAAFVRDILRGLGYPEDVVARPWAQEAG